MKFKKPKIKILLLIWMCSLIIILSINLLLFEIEEQQIDIIYDDKIDTNKNAQIIYDQMLNQNSSDEVLDIPNEEELVKKIELDEAHNRFLESNLSVQNFTE